MVCRFVSVRFSVNVVSVGVVNVGLSVPCRCQGRRHCQFVSVYENLSCLVQSVAFQDARRVLFGRREAGVFGEGQSTTMMNEGVSLVVRVWGRCSCRQLVGGDGQ